MYVSLVLDKQMSQQKQSTSRVTSFMACYFCIPGGFCCLILLSLTFCHIYSDTIRRKKKILLKGTSRDCPFPIPHENSVAQKKITGSDSRDFLYLGQIATFLAEGFGVNHITSLTPQRVQLYQWFPKCVTNQNPKHISVFLCYESGTRSSSIKGCKIKSKNCSPHSLCSPYSSNSEIPLCFFLTLE